MKLYRMAGIICFLAVAGMLCWLNFPVINNPEVEVENANPPVVQSANVHPLDERIGKEDSPSVLYETAAATGVILDAIPFERVTISGLEEVSLQNADREHVHKIRERRGLLSPSPKELSFKLAGKGDDSVLAITLPDASQLEITRIRHESMGPNRAVITGKIVGDQFWEMVLGYVGDAIAGSIRGYRNKAVWEIRNAGDGKQYFAQVDVTAIGECAAGKADLKW